MGLVVVTLPLWAGLGARSAAPGPVADWGDVNGLFDRTAPQPAARPASVGPYGERPSEADPVVSAGYLDAVAQAESGFAPRAHASTSSAAGAFQFVSETWLSTLRRHGPSLGLGLEASFVRIGRDGRAVVADPAVRAALLALRYDPALARAMALALTRDNARTLAAALGRDPTDAELYAAHLLGPGQALALLSAARLAPAYPAAAAFPGAAASNPGLFYAGGSPRSVSGLLREIATKARPNERSITAPRSSRPAEDELVNLAPESASY